jgi:hypothetical protein
MTSPVTGLIRRGRKLTSQDFALILQGAGRNHPGGLRSAGDHVLGSLSVVRAESKLSLILRIIFKNHFRLCWHANAFHFRILTAPSTHC